jgi:predicted nucleic acid-binding protein
MSERYFLDTAFVQALLDKNDQHYAWALRALPIVQNAGQIWITEAVFNEIGAALSGVNRIGAARFIRTCYVTDNITIVPSDRPLFLRGLSLYEARPDKRWSLVDCQSFVVMQDNDIEVAITTDHHFEQAGFRLWA